VAYSSASGRSIRTATHTHAQASTFSSSNSNSQDSRGSSTRGRVHPLVIGAASVGLSLVAFALSQNEVLCVYVCLFVFVCACVYECICRVIVSRFAFRRALSVDMCAWLFFFFFCYALVLIPVFVTLSH
jgi:hypothetical protein